MKKKSKYEEKTKSIKFYNGKGEKLFIPEDYTIKDLLKLGIKEIRLDKRGSFLPEGWYSNEKPKRIITKHETVKQVRTAKQ